MQVETPDVGARKANTEQPHADPIAWMVGTAIWWHKRGAERDSEKTGEPLVPLGPCESQSEIARLTKQFKDWQASHHRNYCKAVDERDELRDQLKQARLLLHTASIRLANWLEQGDDPRKQIIAFLDGSTEPSTPATHYPNRLCHIDYTAHPYRCGCLRGDEESQRIYDEHFRSDEAEASAAAECAICRDLGNQCLECEETEFREWADRHFAAADYRKTASGVFIQDWMRHAFAAWQARGNLEGKP